MFTSVIVKLTSDGLGIDDEEVDVTGGRRLGELVPQVRTVPLRVDVAAVNLSGNRKKARSHPRTSTTS